MQIFWKSNFKVILKSSIVVFFQKISGVLNTHNYLCFRYRNLGFFSINDLLCNYYLILFLIRKILRMNGSFIFLGDLCLKRVFSFLKFNYSRYWLVFWVRGLFTNFGILKWYYFKKNFWVFSQLPDLVINYLKFNGCTNIFKELYFFNCLYISIAFFHPIDFQIPYYLLLSKSSDSLWFFFYLFKSIYFIELFLKKKKIVRKKKFWLKLKKNKIFFLFGHRKLKSDKFQLRMRLVQKRQRLHTQILLKWYRLPIDFFKKNSHFLFLKRLYRFIRKGRVVKTIMQAVWEFLEFRVLILFYRLRVFRIFAIPQVLKFIKRIKIFVNNKRVLNLGYLVKSTAIVQFANKPGHSWYNRAPNTGLDHYVYRRWSRKSIKGLKFKPSYYWTIFYYNSKKSKTLLVKCRHLSKGKRSYLASKSWSYSTGVDGYRALVFFLAYSLKQPFKLPTFVTYRKIQLKTRLKKLSRAAKLSRSWGIGKPRRKPKPPRQNWLSLYLRDSKSRKLQNFYFPKGWRKRLRLEIKGITLRRKSRSFFVTFHCFSVSFFYLLNLIVKSLKFSKFKVRFKYKKSSVVLSVLFFLFKMNYLRGLFFCPKLKTIVVWLDKNVSQHRFLSSKFEVWRSWYLSYRLTRKFFFFNFLSLISVRRKKKLKRRKELSLNFSSVPPKDFFVLAPLFQSLQKPHLQRHNSVKSVTFWNYFNCQVPSKKKTLPVLFKRLRQKFKKRWFVNPWLRLYIFMKCFKPNKFFFFGKVNSQLSSVFFKSFIR